MMPLAKALLLPQVLLLLGVEIGFAFKQTACFAPNALVAGAASRRVPLSSLAAVVAGRSCQPRRALALRGVRGAFQGVPTASESPWGRCQYDVGVGMCGAAGGMSGTDEGRGKKGVEEEGRTISSIQDEQARARAVPLQNPPNTPSEIRIPLSQESHFRGCLTGS